MPRKAGMLTHRRRTKRVATSGAVLCAVLQGPLVVSAADETAGQAAEQIEQNLLHEIEAFETQQGPVTRHVISPLLKLGRFYAATERCDSAILALNHALHVSIRVDGLFQPQQLELLDPLRNCYVALDLQADFERAQHYVLLLNETTYGKDDPRMLPALENAARWYEQAGRYLSARKLYDRAVEIAREDAGDKEDLRMVGPLRGIARAYRLEYMFGLHEADLGIEGAGRLSSNAEFESSSRHLDYLGERSLLRALKILRTHPDARRAQRIETLLDLGDWYQMAYASRDALKIYREVWRELSEPDAPGTALLAKPVPILYRPHVGVALRRPPQEKEELKHYSAEFDFTVTREGRVVDVVVAESDAPKYLQRDLADNLKRTRYRPRFVAGEPVDTPGMHHRQGLYVAK